MTNEGTLVAAFDSQRALSTAVRMLAETGLDDNHISIAGLMFQSQPCAAAVVCDRESWRYRGRQMDAWNQWWQKSHIRGIGFVPTIGPLLIAGPLANLLLDRIEASSDQSEDHIAAVLRLLSVPAARASEYTDALKADALLLVAQTPTSHIGPALATLHRADPLNVDAYVAHGEHHIADHTRSQLSD